MPKACTMYAVRHQELIEILDYNPESGQFIWKQNRGHNQVKNKKAGYIDKKTGYLILSIKKNKYLAHRLAWFYFYAEWPKQTIDHIDKNKLNNRITNLRDIPFTENQWNKKIYDDGRLVGTAFRPDRKSKKWTSAITIFNPKKNKNEPKFLGFYKTEEEAHNAYMLAYNNLKLQNEK